MSLFLKIIHSMKVWIHQFKVCSKNLKTTVLNIRFKIIQNQNYSKQENNRNPQTPITPKTKNSTLKSHLTMPFHWISLKSILIWTKYSHLKLKTKIFSVLTCLNNLNLNKGIKKQLRLQESLILVLTKKKMKMTN